MGVEACREGYTTGLRTWNPQALLSSRQDAHQSRRGDTDTTSVPLERRERERSMLVARMKLDFANRNSGMEKQNAMAQREACSSV
jgi:hypothetical protein